MSSVGPQKPLRTNHASADLDVGESFRTGWLCPGTKGISPTKREGGEASCWASSPASSCQLRGTGMGDGGQLPPGAPGAGALGNGLPCGLSAGRNASRGISPAAQRPAAEEGSPRAAGKPPPGPGLRRGVGGPLRWTPRELRAP